jgi:hypothetical protein
VPGGVFFLGNHFDFQSVGTQLLHRFNQLWNLILEVVGV